MLTYRKVEIKDLDLLFKWANDDLVRESSYSEEKISYDQHKKWFDEKINSRNTLIYIFIEDDDPVGYIRIEKDVKKKVAVISIAIDANKRGHGYSIQMIQKASEIFKEINPVYDILAYIKKDNAISQKVFTKAGFEFLVEKHYNNIPSLIMINRGSM